MIKELINEIVEMVEDAKVKNERLENLEKEVAQKDATIAELNARIENFEVEKEGALAEANANLTAKEALIAELQTQLDAKDTIIADLQAQLDANEEVVALQLADLKNAIETLKELI